MLRARSAHRRVASLGAVGRRSASGGRGQLLAPVLSITRRRGEQPIKSRTSRVAHRHRTSPARRLSLPLSALPATMRLARAAIGQSTLASTSTARALPAACSCRARRLLATGSAPTARGVCASCSKPLASALSTHCPACGTIQPCPPSDDRGRAAFELFELGEPRYTIDKRALKRRFLELQRAVHPDANVAQGGEQAGSRAREWSGWVNGAYRALDGDLSRAEYLVRADPISLRLPVRFLNCSS